jgi:hypothetical protein
MGMTTTDQRKPDGANTPEQIEVYLAHTGWSVDDQLDDGVASIWHRRDNKSAEVVVPLNRSLRDFGERLSDALNSLAWFENRTVDLVLSDIQGLDVDFVRVRVIHEDVADGSIPLDEGVVLNERARDMMMAAAMSSVVRKKTFIGARADLALTYMKSLRLGQTSIGSYIVNVMAPIPVANNEIDPQRPFARIVTENLSDALLSLNEAAEAYQKTSDLTVFDGTVNRGVSSNLCEAVLGMSGHDHQRKIAVSVVATTRLPTEVPTVAVEFSRPHFTAIEAAIVYFKGDYVLENQTIRGYVKRLDREHGDEDGVVSITAVLFGKNEKHITVALRPPEYAEAIKAHEGGLLVEVHGDIHVTPRTATMLNSSGFKVFKNGDLF